MFNIGTFIREGEKLRLLSVNTLERCAFFCEVVMVWTKEQSKKWRLENKDKAQEHDRKYKDKNREKIYSKNREYFCKNRKRLSLYLMAWKKKNPWLSSFYNARNRCQNPKNNRYKTYGERGIKFILTKKDVQVLWLRDQAHLLKQPSIDRIDNDGNYELNNCRFIERVENLRKRWRDTEKAKMKL